MRCVCLGPSRKQQAIFGPRDRSAQLPRGFDPLVDHDLRIRGSLRVGRSVGRAARQLVRVVELVRQRHVEALLKGVVDRDGAALAVMLLEVGGEDLDAGFYERGSSGFSLSLQTTRSR